MIELETAVTISEGSATLTPPPRHLWGVRGEQLTIRKRVEVSVFVSLSVFGPAKRALAIGQDAADGVQQDKERSLIVVCDLIARDEIARISPQTSASKINGTQPGVWPGAMAWVGDHDRTGDA